MWDRDSRNLLENPNFIPYDVVDEFNFDFFATLGSPEVKYNQPGIRPKDPTM